MRRGRRHGVGGGAPVNFVRRRASGPKNRRRNFFKDSQKSLFYPRAGKNLRFFNFFLGF